MEVDLPATNTGLSASCACFSFWSIRAKYRASTSPRTLCTRLNFVAINPASERRNHLSEACYVSTLAYNYSHSNLFNLRLSRKDLSLQMIPEAARQPGLMFPRSATLYIVLSIKPLTRIYHKVIGSPHSSPSAKRHGAMPQSRNFGITLSERATLTLHIATFLVYMTLFVSLFIWWQVKQQMLKLPIKKWRLRRVIMSLSMSVK